MEQTCKVVEDLLPLYYNGIQSKDRLALVESHVKDCPRYSRLLAELRAKSNAVEQYVGDTKLMKKLRRGCKRLPRGWVIAIACLLVLIPAVIAAAVWFFAPTDLFDLVQIDETTFTSVSGSLWVHHTTYNIDKIQKHDPKELLEILTTTGYILDHARSNTESSNVSISGGEDYDGQHVSLIFYVRQGGERVELWAFGTNSIAVWVRGTTGYKVFRLTNSETFEKLVEYMETHGVEHKLS